MGTQHDASIVAVLGQSGQGKGVYSKARVRAENPARLLIWDAMNEWADYARGWPTLTHLGRQMLRNAAAPWRFRYMPKAAAYSDAIKREFSAFCMLALAAKNCTVVIEELSFVTLAGYAPPGWAKVCNAGRHAGLRVIGISQAPADIDKKFLGNCTEIVTFYLGERPHRETVAVKLDTDPDTIKALPQFHFLHFDRASRTVTPGALPPPGAGSATGSNTAET